MRGVMDLTGESIPGDMDEWDIHTDGKIALSGEWELYWGQLLQPEDFNATNAPAPIYISVPQAWKKVEIDGTIIEPKGYATYRLVIKLPEPGDIGIKMPVENSFYRLWINGEFIDESEMITNGLLKTYQKYVYAYVTTETPEVEIIWQLGNELMPRGGVFESPYIGNEPDMRQWEKTSVIFEIMLIGSLLIMAFFNLTLFVMRKKEAGSLIFAIFAFVMVGTVIFSGEIMLISYIIELRWMIVYRISTILILLAISAFYHFLHYLYWQDSSILYIVLTDSLILILVLLTIVFPDRLVPYMGYLFMIFWVTSVGIALTVIKAVRKKRSGVYLIIIGSLCFFGTSFADYLAMTGMIESPNLTWVGLFILVAFQSILLAQRFSQSLNRSERLTYELETKNKALNNLTDQLEIKVEERTRELTDALDHLKRIQNQVIVQEKLASLGKLTAGIAHEIKNPLNFVNNFSLISVELISELKTDLSRVYDRLDAAVRENVEENFELLKTNIEKINEHGKRADGIVKAMLLHSREKSGEASRTDINDLIEEYLNLSYHGMRALDPSFIVTIERNFAPDLKPIIVFRQDLGRVFMNLFNNAFYSVNEKRTASGSPDYAPGLEVTTSVSGEYVEIRVRDNGTGIPQDVQNRIFTPFFTTKPTGQGTGLGLSLTHDIIVQVHRGEIDIGSVEGEYAEFTVRLPLNSENGE